MHIFINIFYSANMETWMILLTYESVGFSGNNKFLKLPRGEKFMWVKHLFSPGEVVVVLWGQCRLWVHMGVWSPPLYFSRAYIGRVHRSQVYRLMNSHMCSTQMKMQRISFIPEGSLMPWVTSLSLLAPSLSLACPRYDRWYHLVCPFCVWLLSLILRSGARSVMFTCSLSFLPMLSRQRPWDTPIAE